MLSHVTCRNNRVGTLFVLHPMFAPSLDGDELDAGRSSGTILASKMPASGSGRRCCRVTLFRTVSQLGECDRAPAHGAAFQTRYHPTDAVEPTALGIDGNRASRLPLSGRNNSTPGRPPAIGGSRAPAARCLADPIAVHALDPSRASSEKALDPAPFRSGTGPWSSSMP